MKISVIVLTTVTVLISIFSHAPAWSDEPGTLFCVADDVRVRENPDTKSTILGKLINKNRVVLLGQGSCGMDTRFFGDWCE